MITEIIGNYNMLSIYLNTFFQKTHFSFVPNITTLSTSAEKKKNCTFRNMHNQHTFSA